MSKSFLMLLILLSQKVFYDDFSYGLSKLNDVVITGISLHGPK